MDLYVQVQSATKFNLNNFLNYISDRMLVFTKRIRKTASLNGIQNKFL